MAAAVLLSLLSPLRAQVFSGAEIFFDDPNLAEGLGDPIAIADQSGVSGIASANFDLSGLPTGHRAIYIRLQLPGGAWSDPIRQSLFIPERPAPSFDTLASFTGELASGVFDINAGTLGIGSGGIVAFGSTSRPLDQISPGASVVSVVATTTDGRVSNVIEQSLRIDDRNKPDSSNTIQAASYRLDSGAEVALSLTPGITAFASGTLNIFDISEAVQLLSVTASDEASAATTIVQSLNAGDSDGDGVPDLFDPDGVTPSDVIFSDGFESNPVR
jgi:hypothetical protein